MGGLPVIQELTASGRQHGSLPGEISHKPTSVPRHPSLIVVRVARKPTKAALRRLATIRRVESVNTAPLSRTDAP